MDAKKMAIRGNNWSERELQVLFQSWRDSSVLSIFDGKTKNTKAYRIMASILAQEGVQRTVAQVNVKVKQLRRSYYKAKDAVSRSGAAPEAVQGICPHYRTLDQLLGTRPSATPHHLRWSVELPSASPSVDSIITDSEGQIGEDRISESEDTASGSDETNALRRYFVDKFLHGDGLENASVEPLQNERVEPDHTPELSEANGRIPLAIPGSDRRRKRKASENSTMLLEWLEKEMQVEREESKKIQERQERLWKQQLDMEKELQRREEERFNRRLEADEEASQGMLALMGNMLNIMSRMTTMPHTSWPVKSDMQPMTQAGTTLPSETRPATSSSADSMNAKTNE